MFDQFPILSTIVYIPLIGSLYLIFFVRKDQPDSIRWIANGVALFDFLVSLLLLVDFKTADANFQFVEDVSWIDAIGVRYIFGMDGISLMLVILTTFLGFIAVLSSWSAIQKRVKEFYVLLLLLQTGMLGVFLALDLFLFYVFWEVMLVPMYFLIGVWGSSRRLYAAIKFFLYTLAGSVLMLLGILALYYHGYSVLGVYSFDLRVLMQLDFPVQLQWWVFIAFFIGFAIKVPMFPFHTWLPDAHTEAPTAGSIILAGVLLKMGTYGFVRFSLPLMPDAAVNLVWFMVLLSIIGIIYGALVALMQKDWKRLVAYSSVSHLGFCMLGIFTLNPVGLNGGILQMLNHGLSTGALFLIVGIAYERRHTRMIADYGGLSNVMPLFAVYFLIITLASIGLPTLNGFIGEFMILQGAFLESITWAVFAASGIVLGAAYMLWLYQRLMFGNVDNPKNKGLRDVNSREALLLALLSLGCFWIGIYPKPFLAYIEPPVMKIVQKVRPDYAAAQMAAVEAADVSKEETEQSHGYED